MSVEGGQELPTLYAISGNPAYRHRRVSAPIAHAGYCLLALLLDDQLAAILAAANRH